LSVQGSVELVDVSEHPITLKFYLRYMQQYIVHLYETQHG
jgi:hypothetical protein